MFRKLRIFISFLYVGFRVLELGNYFPHEIHLLSNHRANNPRSAFDAGKKSAATTVIAANSGTAQSTVNAHFTNLRAWMRLVVGALQSLKGHMGINLCRRKVGVAEQFLHTAQIRARIEQMRGETVTKFVRCNP